jgi:hypothetical protein
LMFWLVEIGDGLAVFGVSPGDDLLNPIGTLHGGWAMTLSDSAIIPAEAVSEGWVTVGDGRIFAHGTSMLMVTARGKMTRRPPYQGPPAVYAVL